MIAAQGILTSRGGKTSHAAVVARGMGKTCVCGAEELDVDTKARKMTAPGGVVVQEGDVISIDGTSGDVYLGEVAVVPSPVVQYFEGDLDPQAADAGDLVRPCTGSCTHADATRRMRVRANADTSEDADRARRMGAEGIGLCRTEHMFLGERKQLRRAAHPGRERRGEEDAPSTRCFRCSARTSSASSRRWTACRSPSGCSTRRCTSSCPTAPSSPVRVALAEARGETDENDLRLLQAVNRLHEQNPMLGLRGVRLGLVIPGLFALAGAGHRRGGVLPPAHEGLTRRRRS